MRFTGRTRSRRFLHVEITPMIDVVFLLIIFFMTTAQFARITREQIDLPVEAGEQREDPEESGIVVNITADGRFVVAGETLVLDELEAIVEAEKRLNKDGDVRVMIRADRNLDAALFNDLIQRLHELGVGGAGVATEVPR